MYRAPTESGTGQVLLKDFNLTSQLVTHVHISHSQCVCVHVQFQWKHLSKVLNAPSLNADTTSSKKKKKPPKNKTKPKTAITTGARSLKKIKMSAQVIYR